MCKPGCGCGKTTRFSVPKMNEGGKIAPGDPPAKTGKRARIIANAAYDDFQKEYDRTKDKYAEFYPGGVEFVNAYGQDELSNAFDGVQEDEDLIMMAHFNDERMYGTKVANWEEEGASQDGTIAGMFKGLQNRGYKGNCYMGICHSEITGKTIQQAGVDLPFYTAPSSQQWMGGNTAGKTFEDFFFGITGTKDAPIAKKGTMEGEDYKMLAAPGMEERMKEKPIRSERKIKFTPRLNAKNPLEKEVIMAANQF